MKPTGVTFLPQFHLNFLFERFYSWHSIQYMYKYSVTKVLKVPPKAICCYCSSMMELHVLPKNTMCHYETKMCKIEGGPFSGGSLHALPKKTFEESWCTIFWVQNAPLCQRSKRFLEGFLKCSLTLLRLHMEFVAWQWVEQTLENGATGLTMMVKATTHAQFEGFYQVCTNIQKKTFNTFGMHVWKQS